MCSEVEENNLKLRENFLWHFNEKFYKPPSRVEKYLNQSSLTRFVKYVKLSVVKIFLILTSLTNFSLTNTFFTSIQFLCDKYKLQNLLVMVGILVLIAITMSGHGYVFVTILGVAIILYGFIVKIYLRAARDLKQLEGISEYFCHLSSKKWP